jgi:hypothetical protein
MSETAKKPSALIAVGSRKGGRETIIIDGSIIVDQASRAAVVEKLARPGRFIVFRGGAKCEQ